MTAAFIALILAWGVWVAHLVLQRLCGLCVWNRAYNVVPCRACVAWYSRADSSSSLVRRSPDPASDGLTDCAGRETRRGKPLLRRGSRQAGTCAALPFRLATSNGRAWRGIPASRPRPSPKKTSQGRHSRQACPREGGERESAVGARRRLAPTTVVPAQAGIYLAEVDPCPSTSSGQAFRGGDECHDFHHYGRAAKPTATEGGLDRI